jgi:hypothetical protein
MRVITMSRAVAAIAVLALTGGCSDDPTGPPLPPLPDPSFGSMAVLPQSATIEPGQVLALRVSLIDEFGHQVEGAPIKWMSSNPSVASVTAGGQVRGLSVGHTVITAEAITMTGMKSQSSTIQVLRPVPRPEIDLKRPNIEPWKLH